MLSLAGPPMLYLRRRIFAPLQIVWLRAEGDLFRREFSTGVEEGWNLSPVVSVVHVINNCNDLSPFHWWTTISLTAITLRLMLFPLTIKQIQSSSSNFRLMGQAWQITQSQIKPKRPELKAVYDKFQKLRKYSGAINPAWIIGAPLIQIPSFLVLVMAVRRVCTEGWPGLDTGGALWFTDLTQHTVSFLTLQTHLGPTGAILPIAITLSYLLNLELSFRSGRVGGNVSGSVGDKMAKLLKFLMEWLAIPTLIITLQLPQGSLVYWLTSSCCSIGQNLLLGNPAFRQRLNLPTQKDSSVDVMENFSPAVMDLFLKAAEHRAAGKSLDAILSLDQIIKEDTKNARAHYAKGQLHGEMKQWDKAIEHYQLAFQHEDEDKMKAKSLLGIGIAQYMKREIVDSEKTLLAALKIEHKDLAVLMALCSLYKHTGKLERAKEIVDYATEIDSRCKQWEKHL